MSALGLGRVKTLCGKALELVGVATRAAFFWLEVRAIPANYGMHQILRFLIDLPRCPTLRGGDEPRS